MVVIHHISLVTLPSPIGVATYCVPDLLWISGALNKVCNFIKCIEYYLKAIFIEIMRFF